MDVTKDLLTLARDSESITETNIVDVTAVAAETWEPLCEATNTLALPSEEAVIECDRTRLRRLLGHLMRNTVEHTSTPLTLRAGRLSPGFISLTTAPVSTRPSGRRCSSRATRRPTTAPGSGCRSSSGSPTPMGGTSPSPKAMPAGRGSSSGLGCRPSGWSRRGPRPLTTPGGRPQQGRRQPHERPSTRQGWVVLTRPIRHCQQRRGRPRESRDTGRHTRRGRAVHQRYPALTNRVRRRSG